MRIMNWGDLTEALNIKMENLRDDIEAANDNEDYEQARKLCVQLEAVERTYCNL